MIEIILDLRASQLRLENRISDLESSLLASERKSKRQAAPFRREESKLKSEKKPPGRKGGHKGHYRYVPSQIDEVIEVGLDPDCPYCSSTITSIEQVEQFIEEIPELRPHVIQLLTYKGICTGCKRVIRSHHPQQLGHAQGSAKVHLGRRASALVLSLQHQYGLSKRKLSKLLKEVLGLSISPGGIVHLSHRMAGKFKSEYEKLLHKAATSSYIHADETSWYVGDPKHWLWVFCNEELTLYQVEPSRGRKVIHQVLGEEYQGVLISDCLASYDNANEIQHKCYAHHLKELCRLIQVADKDPPSPYLSKWKQLFRVSMALKEQKHDLDQQVFLSRCRLLAAVAEQLLSQNLEDPLEQKFAHRIQKQKDHLFTFLVYDQVDPTNNLAERQLRPAVIARKVSCGNRTLKGAKTWQSIASISATNQQIKKDFFHTVNQAISRHLNLLKANELLKGIGPLNINKFESI